MLLYHGVFIIFCYSTLWGIGEYCKMKQLEFRKKGMFFRRDVVPEHARNEVPEDGVIELKCAFLRHLYKNDKKLPKNHLYAFALQQNFKVPVYKTIQVDKRFKSVVTFNNLKYSSSFWYVKIYYIVIHYWFVNFCGSYFNFTFVCFINLFNIKTK